MDGILTNIHTLENQKSKWGIYFIHTASSNPSLNIHLTYFSNIAKPIPFSKLASILDDCSTIYMDFLSLHSIQNDLYNYPD